MGKHLGRVRSKGHSLFKARTGQFERCGEAENSVDVLHHRPPPRRRRHAERGEAPGAHMVRSVHTHLHLAFKTVVQRAVWGISKQVWLLCSLSVRWERCSRVDGLQ